MSTIGSNPPPIHPAAFDPAGGQVSFDDLLRQGLQQADAGLALPEAAPAALVDPGETVLNLSAWGEGEASRALPRSDAFEGRLAGLDRGEAAGEAVDGILASF
ncbi:MAG: hypothetical protein KIS72_02705 [Luteimonas sp.]|nr:hypothetical protein [Luteimonas sp.]